MDLLLRTIAIIVEVLILVGISYAILDGFRLAIFHLGIKTKYDKVIIMSLLLVGVIIVVFFIAHLTTFYPGGSYGN